MESNSGIIILIFYLAIIGFFILCAWKIYEKAGRPGWEAIIPIYNMYILVTKIALKEAWWMILLFIPIVNFIVFFIIYMEVAKNFGKSEGFGVGLALLSFIFIPILAFGDAEFLPGKEAEDEIDLILD